MAQVTIYVSARLAAAAKRAAKRSKKSLSAWFAEVLQRELEPSRWPQSVIDVVTKGHGDIIEPEDPPSTDDDVEGFE